MRKIWAYLMLLGFAISFFIHFSVYTLDTTNLTRKTPMPMPFVILHFGAMAGAYSLSRASQKPDMKAILSHTPKWAQNLVWTFGTFSIINFLIHFTLLFTDLSDSGSGLKHITLAFSGHWMAFYIAPAMSYLFSPQKAKNSE
jgi:uncharacterized protein involved in cysteine biosynthesis